MQTKQIQPIYNNQPIKTTSMPVVTTPVEIQPRQVPFQPDLQDTLHLNTTTPVEPPLPLIITTLKALDNIANTPNQHQAAWRDCIDRYLHNNTLEDLKALQPYFNSDLKNDKIFHRYIAYRTAIPTPYYPSPLAVLYNNPYLQKKDYSEQTSNHPETSLKKLLMAIFLQEFKLKIPLLATETRYANFFTTNEPFFTQQIHHFFKDTYALLQAMRNVASVQALTDFVEEKKKQANTLNETYYQLAQIKKSSLGKNKEIKTQRDNTLKKEARNAYWEAILGRALYKCSKKIYTKIHATWHNDLATIKEKLLEHEAILHYYVSKGIITGYLSERDVYKQYKKEIKAWTQDLVDSIHREFKPVLDKYKKTMLQQLKHINFTNLPAFLHEYAYDAVDYAFYTHDELVIWQLKENQLPIFKKESQAMPTGILALTLFYENLQKNIYHIMHSTEKYMRKIITNS